MGDIVPVCFTVDVSTFLPIISIVCSSVPVIRTFPKHALHLKDLDSFILHTKEDWTPPYRSSIHVHMGDSN